MKLSQNYFAVGSANDNEKLPCIVLVVNGNEVMRMPENHARKLADDLIRNANFLWPIEGEE